MKACLRCGAALSWNREDTCLLCRYKAERDAALARVKELEAQLDAVLDYCGPEVREWSETLTKTMREARALLAKGQVGEEGK